MTASEINKTLAEWAGVKPEIRCKAGVNDPSRECSGKSIEKAFGAPGDWRYGTPIGDALANRN